MRRVGVVLAVILLIAAAPTSSERPSPSGGNAQTVHKANTAQEGQNSGTDQPGTKATPLVIQIDQSKGHEAIATEAKEEGHWYALPDWWVAGFTGALFMVTVGLWVATFLLWRSTNKAVVDASKGLRIAQQTLSHSREVSHRQLRLTSVLLILRFATFFWGRSQNFLLFLGTMEPSPRKMSNAFS
jgi:hypothetical protein